MGDRVVIQFKTAKGEVSPVIYGHWSGETAPDAIARLYQRMRDRPDDIEYIAARCLQEVGMIDATSTGFGIWNAPPHGELDPGDSQGDATARPHATARLSESATGRIEPATAGSAA